MAMELPNCTGLWSLGCNGYHCLWEFWRSTYREIDVCVHSSFPTILCRSVLPSSFPTPIFDSDVCEYTRLLAMLDIPPLSHFPRQDTLQNALSGWCAHYAHSHASAQLNCGILLIARRFIVWRGYLLFSTVCLTVSIVTRFLLMLLSVWFLVYDGVFAE